jgi:large conductance mechanosensitive channel
LLKEFKAFILRGNLVEIAVAFVIGAAFSQVVAAFTTRIVSPLIALIVGLPDMSGMWLFGEIDEATGIKSGSLGAFVAAGIDFLIVGFVMFLVVKAYNRATAKEAAEEPTPEPDESLELLREIRDSLRRG